MSMLLLINNITKVNMQKIIFISIILYTGCTKQVTISNTSQLSCTQEAKPKSLQFLEQQYRCTSQN